MPRRFVTKAELEKLGIGHLVGTRLLRAYMHGFFLHNRLWNKARAIAEPFMYDSYRKERVTEKLEAERKSRIGLKRKLPKVCLFWRCRVPPLSPPSSHCTLGCFSHDCSAITAKGDCLVQQWLSSLQQMGTALMSLQDVPDVLGLTYMGEGNVGWCNAAQ